MAKKKKNKISCENCEKISECLPDFRQLAKFGLSEVAKKTSAKSKLHKILLREIGKLCLEYISEFDIDEALNKL